jgi:hypothetical protein
MRARARASLVAAALALVMVAGVTSDAGAHLIPPTSTCSTGALCVHWDAHHHGQKFTFFTQNHSWNHGGGCGGGGDHGHCWAINDDDSSSWNKTADNNRARIFQNSQEDGWWPQIVCLTPGQYASHHSPTDAGSGNTWPASCN